MPSRSRAFWGALLAAYTLFIAAALVAPVPTVASGVVGGTEGILSAIGLPAVVTEPGRVEFVLNAAMFAPVSLLAALTWPRHHWANWVVYGFAGSVAVEAVQAIFLPDRSAQFVDVVANTLGALAGAVVSVPVRDRVYADTTAPGQAD